MRRSPDAGQGRKESSGLGEQHAAGVQGLWKLCSSFSMSPASEKSIALEMCWDMDY